MGDILEKIYGGKHKMNNVAKYTVTALWLGGLAVTCYAAGVLTGKAVTYAYCKLTLPIMNKIL